MKHVNVHSQSTVEGLNSEVANRESNSPYQTCDQIESKLLWLLVDEESDMNHEWTLEDTSSTCDIPQMGQEYFFWTLWKFGLWIGLILGGIIFIFYAS